MTPARLPLLLVAHRGLGEGLMTAAEAILGDKPALEVLSNDGLSPEALGQKIDAWVARHEGPVVILADLDFGSCCQSARRVTREQERVGIVSGVNLPVLLAALRSSAEAELSSFLRHLAERGAGSLKIYRGGVPL